MSKRSSADEFLQNMNGGVATEEPAPRVQPAKIETTKQLSPSVIARKSLKHIGGYCDNETREKAALLRIRLGLDNSELVTLAINELFSKHKAKQAFDGAS